MGGFGFCDITDFCILRSAAFSRAALVLHTLVRPLQSAAHSNQLRDPFLQEEKSEQVSRVSCREQVHHIVMLHMWPAGSKVGHHHPTTTFCDITDFCILRSAAFSRAALVLHTLVRPLQSAAHSNQLRDPFLQEEKSEQVSRVSCREQVHHRYIIINIYI